MTWNRRVLWGLAATLALLAAAPSIAETGQASVLAAIVRDEEPVVLSGASFPALAGQPITSMVVMRWNGTSLHYEPIPFQIDERIAKTFDAAPSGTFVETIHDVAGEDDGLFDADDEIVVRFGDGGAQAPLDSWPPAADEERFEIVVNDPRPDAPVPQRRFYVFTGNDLPTSGLAYVSWNGAANTTVSTASQRIVFVDRWLATGYAVEAPCGAGVDLIDRFKGRAGRNLDNESEQEWNASSEYMGGYSGPIRAIRYVRGAASAINTIHYDVMYRERWDRNVMLRVHPIPAIAIYFDLLPIGNARLFTPAFPAGLSVDGVPESGGITFQPWSLVRTPLGGFVVLYDAPPSPFYGSKRNFYRDDTSYDDALTAFYDDEDNSAYGAQGFEMRDLIGDPLDRIDLGFRMYPLCAGTGDADTGAAYQALKDQPLANVVTPQLRAIAPIRSLRLRRVGADVLLDWDPVPGATSYLVLAASSASEPREFWTQLDEVPTPNWIDSGAGLSETPRQYSILGVTPAGTTPW
ncbi:MAG TPA: hypothetical protein VF139_02425 [Candidatus Polarisedimenticolaceae bacterium]